MRKRNCKINVYLNENENKILKEKSNKIKLSQSEFIRHLIFDYSENNLSNEDIENISKNILEGVNDLVKLKNRLNHFGFVQDEEFLNSKMNELNKWINKLKR